MTNRQLQPIDRTVLTLLIRHSDDVPLEALADLAGLIMLELRASMTRLALRTETVFERSN